MKVFIENALARVSPAGLIATSLLFGFISMMPKYQMILVILIFGFFSEEILGYACKYICKR